jgi:pantoate--beta-alanine ligase
MMAAMETCESILAFKNTLAAARRGGRTIGLVPTMGNLHAGHASLIDRAVADGHFVAATLFVNPTQFGPGEDYARYPRTPQEDLELCRRHGVAVIFMPPVEGMYPEQGLTTVHVAELTTGLCGRSRPGHFDGVSTVVAKLFNIAAPEAAYFGQKDAQQVAVITRMVHDLNFPLRMVVCPTVREEDGLAMSSRNRYLSGPQRPQAAQLYAALKLAQAMAAQGQADAQTLIAAMRKHLETHAPLGQLEYAEIVNPQSLAPVQRIDRPALAALAVRFEGARLIDNTLVEVGPRKA